MHLLIPEGKLIDCGLDWLTLTAPTKSDEAKDLAETAGAFFDFLSAKGEIYKDGRLMQYEGIKTRSAFWGTSYQGDILQVTGSEAKTVLDFCKQSRSAPRCARADLQGTFKLPKDEPDLPVKIRDLVQNQPAKQKFGRVPVTRLYESGRKGNTVYIGSPKSDRTRRQYDKERESKGAYGFPCVRLESQGRNEVAQGMFSQMLRSRDAAKMASAAIWEDWSRVGFDVPALLIQEEYEPMVIKPETDLEKTLRWLTTDVRPSVDRCRDAGALMQVIAALGLDAPRPDIADCPVPNIGALIATRQAERDNAIEKRNNLRLYTEYEPRC